MIKLRLGKEFGSPGGAAWRLFFAVTLMPWLRKYRENLGVSGEDRQEEDRRSGLRALSKDALVDNFVVLEERYRALADKLKGLGEHVHLDGMHVPLVDGILKKTHSVGVA